mgnify:CR=1 FL=1
MIYFQLFLSFLQIGAFSFGGGYAAMPLIQNQVVTLHGWLNLAEFTDLVTISQMTLVPLPSMPPPSWAPALQVRPGPWRRPLGACCRPASWLPFLQRSISNTGI